MAKSEAQVRRQRNVSTAPVAKFVVGTRVVVDFTVGGPIYGLTKRQCRVRGLITGIRGKFLRTPDVARWLYRIRLDRYFCSEEVWNLEEKYLQEER